MYVEFFNMRWRAMNIQPSGLISAPPDTARYRKVSIPPDTARTASEKGCLKTPLGSEPQRRFGGLANLSHLKRLERWYPASLRLNSTSTRFNWNLPEVDIDLDKV